MTKTFPILDKTQSPVGVVLGGLREEYGRQPIAGTSAPNQPVNLEGLEEMDADTISCGRPVGRCNAGTEMT